MIVIPKIILSKTVNITDNAITNVCVYMCASVSVCLKVKCNTTF